MGNIGVRTIWRGEICCAIVSEFIKKLSRDVFSCKIDLFYKTGVKYDRLNATRVLNIVFSCAELEI